QNRGQIVDELLNGHEQLVQTVEGQVFESFYAQLVKSSELQEMKSRIRLILENINSEKALSRKQRAELKQLVSRLVYESERVIQARSHSERDVRGFLKSGLANEQLRVGALLQDIFQTSLELDWQNTKLRRTEGPLPPLAISAGNLPLIERLLPKQIEGKELSELELDEFQANPAEMGDEFWRAYRALDREALFRRTLQELQQSGEKLTIGQLAKAIVPTHDLETLAFWLAMARQAGIEIGEGSESLDLSDSEEGTTRFHVPWVEVAGQDVQDLKVESME
ncbi:MAG: DUF3375 family protein, partial [Pirellula sp.]